MASSTCVGIFHELRSIESGDVSEYGVCEILICLSANFNYFNGSLLKMALRTKKSGVELTEKLISFLIEYVFSVLVDSIIMLL